MTLPTWLQLKYDSGALRDRAEDRVVAGNVGALLDPPWPTPRWEVVYHQKLLPEGRMLGILLLVEVNVPSRCRVVPRVVMRGLPFVARTKPVDSKEMFLFREGTVLDAAGLETQLLPRLIVPLIPQQGLKVAVRVPLASAPY